MRSKLPMCASSYARCTSSHSGLPRNVSPAAGPSAQQAAPGEAAPGKGEDEDAEQLMAQQCSRRDDRCCSSGPLPLCNTRRDVKRPTWAWAGAVGWCRGARARACAARGSRYCILRCCCKA